MDNGGDDSDGLIHPALRARRSQIAAIRRMQISLATTTALPSLADTVASVPRTAEATVRLSKVAQILLAVEPGLTAVSSSVQRWHNGEVPTSAETDAVLVCMRVICAALNTAKELCAGGNAVRLVSSASEDLPRRYPQRDENFTGQL